ncbi:MAG TPA: tRNA (adenosine(37)-N6)-threonylcarbamoyltransferase complex dimerization subunit type 1 TsaB [Streptosporangiaceae bacterium]|nr:tRNA (adenosine(37)-N6)-threonylcarbamoyltransferase complex dimerization subunit type 1 TsaB [Streptosporangiaceae bacterium]
MLALDTATPAMTVALHDGSRVLADRVEVSSRGHGELLAAMIEQVLTAAGADRGDLEAVAVGTGPGPYTGMRAGLVTARVLASALGVPAVGVCTLDVIARAAAPAADGREFVVAADARRKEVYWARYTPEGKRAGEPGVALPAALAAQIAAEIGPSCPVAGQGPELYRELAGSAIPPSYPDAGLLAEIALQCLALGAPDGPPEPLYLRRPDARVPGKPKKVTPA